MYINFNIESYFIDSLHKIVLLIVLDIKCDL